MNSRTLLVLLTVLTVTGTISVSAYAAEVLDPNCLNCTMEEIREKAKELLLKDVPVSIWTDKTDYDHNDKIIVTGKIGTVIPDVPVVVVVTSPLGSLVSINQIALGQDGNFDTEINTGGVLWQYDGTYIIKATHGGSAENTVNVELTGGVTYIPNYATPQTKCSANEIAVLSECIPYTISGGNVIEATANTKDKSIIITIEATDDGILKLQPPTTAINGIYIVFVDDEQWDDVEITDREVVINFKAGAEKIEIIGTYVIPEFGMIAVMILTVAIISIIAISARSRLSIIPRY